jgi:Lar family restriction alleviation protein
MTSNPLLPCPFCGHDTPIVERAGTRRYSTIIACGNCGARHESGDEDANVGRSWNQRAAVETTTALVYGLESRLEFDAEWKTYFALYPTIEKAREAMMNARPVGSEWRVVPYRRADEAMLTQETAAPIRETLDFAVQVLERFAQMADTECTCESESTCKYHQAAEAAQGVKGVLGPAVKANGDTP